MIDFVGNPMRMVLPILLQDKSTKNCYDTSTGDYIEPVNRIGILDRKLRVVNENTENEEDWFKWTLRTFQSVYGYEYQGDNLLLARGNLLLTFVEYYQNRWKCQPPEK